MREEKTKGRTIEARPALPPWAWSIVSYPDRGIGGDAKYRGNWGAAFVEGLVRTYYASGLVVDPMEGSGTSRDVCARLGVPYRGFDLRDGFDLTRESLRDRLPEPASLVLLHPPYHDMVTYSGGQWGSADPRDLSRCPDYATFLGRLSVAVSNAFDALAPNGLYTILVADLRRNGEYIGLTSDVRSICPGRAVGTVVKGQVNCASGRVQYSGKFVPITHELLHVYRKA